MFRQVVRKPLGLLIVLIASVTTLPSIPRPEQERITYRGLILPRDSDPKEGNCLATSELIYVETVIVVKDDSSHINGTLEISVGNPIRIDCVRIVAKTEHDRSALKGFKLSGTNKIVISVAEEQPSQSNALEYSVYVYAELDKPTNKYVATSAY
ncbi:uncharacterized protein LOC128718715 [Anopheles marshallii]|uniref:uncharacterized protein LOC128718715 n=1 Tax=Anopheles marshallii TaxID=1521116 RepID=UPI00237AACB4|nr:uncharacterized protein LOC128718715 [Anopheles marshallii]